MEAIPADALTPRENVVFTHCFVDADHAVDRDIRRYQTWVLIFLNKELMLWYSKQQNTVKNSMFSSKFIDIKTATELVKSLWYKLCMSGIPIEIPNNMLCDNEDIHKHAWTPESTLKNNNVSICYHK